jgi:hypothetical protein
VSFQPIGSWLVALYFCDDGKRRDSNYKKRCYKKERDSWSCLGQLSKIIVLFFLLRNERYTSPERRRGSKIVGGSLPTTNNQQLR